MRTGGLVLQVMVKTGMRIGTAAFALGLCLAGPQAAGVAAALAIQSDRTVRDVDIDRVQRTLTARGADPGILDGPNREPLTLFAQPRPVTLADDSLIEVAA